MNKLSIRTADDVAGFGQFTTAADDANHPVASAVLNTAVGVLTVVPVIGPLFAIPLVVRRDVKETPGGRNDTTR